MAQAQKGSVLTAAEANQLFRKLYGNWRVKTLIWQPELNKFSETVGQVRYSTDENEALTEMFDIAQPDGSIKHQEGTLRYAEAQQRFEFVQHDTFGRPMIMMVGKWDPRFNMIEMKPVKGQKNLTGRGKLRLQLQYFFFDDGSFKKVTKTPDGQGSYLIASEYHCRRQNTAGL